MIDLEGALDGQRITGRHIFALFMCGFALIVDGYDIYIVGSIGPAIVAQFRVLPSALASVFFLQQCGLTAGAFLISPISDRLGRKRVLLSCTAAFGLLTLAAMLSSSLFELAVFRCAAGVFLAGVTPNAIALLVEATPRRKHGLFVSLAFIGFGAGAALGAVVAALLLRRYGWHSAFWIGGVVPLAYVLVAVWAVPESIPFLLRKNPSHPAIGATLRRLNLDPDTQYLEQLHSYGAVRGSRLTNVFAAGRAPVTFILWTVFSLSIGTQTLLLAWMPTLFSRRGGIPLHAYSAVAAFALTASLGGPAVIGYFLDGRRPFRLLMALYLLTALAELALGSARFGTLLFPLSMLAFLTFFASGQIGMNAMATRFYPVEVRSTGVGWAFGAGRIGSIAGPVLGGLLLRSDVTIARFFLCTSIPMILVAGLLFVLDRATVVSATGAVERKAD